MKNLTHYFQVAKSPTDESASGSDANTVDNADVKKKVDEDEAVVVDKCSPKPKKLSLKSKKSQLDSNKNEGKDNAKNAAVMSPDSTVGSSEKKKRSKKTGKSSEKDVKTAGVSVSPPKSFANSMQDILQQVLKKKVSTPSNADVSTDDAVNTTCDTASSSVVSKSDETDNTNDKTCDEISSSVPPKSSGKKRGRKPKILPKEDSDTPSGKLSYEELEVELMKERILLAKLKETFLASNPDAESVAKYNSTLGRNNKITLGSPTSENESHHTPKSVKGKLANGVASDGKQVRNTSKKARLSTSRSPSKSLPKNTKVLAKSGSVKNTPENNTKLMKEVLEYLDHTDSKVSTPSPKKSSPRSKSTQRKDKSEAKSKKQLEFPDDEVDEKPEKTRKRKKKGKSESEENPLVEDKKKTVTSPKKMANEEKKIVSSVSPLEKKRKRKKKSESTDDVEELIAPPLSVSPKKKSTKKSAHDEKEQISEPSSPPKKKKMKVSVAENVSGKKESNKKEKGSDSAAAGKKKLNGKKNIAEPKKIPKESSRKKSDKSTKSSGIISDKDQAKLPVDLDSSSDSVFVESSSQKAKESESSSQKMLKAKAEKESAENKTLKVDSSETVDSAKKNSLLNYFGKVDKTYLKKEEKSACLTTRAIIHSPPVSPSKKRKSTGPPFSPRRKKLKSMLADADKIELLSSEVVPNTVDDGSGDTNHQEETEIVNTHHSQGKPSPKKWSMRVKLAVHSPAKTAVTDKLSNSSAVDKSLCEEGSPESKVKRKLFDAESTPPIKATDGSNSSESADVEVIVEKTTSCKADGKESSEVPQTSVEGKEIAKSLTCMNEENATPKPPVKLASIFLKKSTPKVPSSGTSDSPIVIDEESLKAKKEFLNSGMPDLIKQKSEQLKALEKLEEEDYFVPFPKISHVGFDNSPMNANSQAELEKSFKFRSAGLSTIASESLKKSWEKIIEHVPSQIPAITDDCYWAKCGDVKRQQRYLKKQAANFPFEIFEKHFEKSMLQEQKSSNKNQEMWTEKYKPQSSQEVLGNGARVSELKQWLEEQKASKKKYENSDDSSGDEFISSDDDSSLTKRLNNIAILVGPSGCGKTSSVYAVAKELGCKVLELNASCNRNGKKVLAELLEATQSHQVKQVSSILEDMFSKSKKRGDKKKKKKESKPKKLEGQDSDSKVMSIILIEDADLIFSDHDDGFIAALSSLSSLSKRPIILVANSIQCSHISKFIKQHCLLLEYSKPSFSDIKTWLQLIAVFEAVELPSEVAEKVVYETNKDVRQAMLNLQYHILSTLKPQTNSDVGWPVDVGKLWWQWPSPFSIPPLIIETMKKSKPLLLETSDEKIEPNSEVSDQSPKPVIPSPEDCLKFHRLASFVDSLALTEIWSSSSYHVSNSEDPSPRSWHTTVGDSCILHERTHPEHAGHDSISEALCHQLVSRHARSLDMKFKDCIQCRLSPDIARWKIKQKKLEEVLLTGLPMYEQIDRESACCDYLPMIRSIGRSECLRLVENSKRANRFFNYLSSMNIHPDESQRTLMCNAFAFVNKTAVQS